METPGPHFPDKLGTPLGNGDPLLPPLHSFTANVPYPNDGCRGSPYFCGNGLPYRLSYILLGKQSAIQRVPIFTTGTPYFWENRNPGSPF